MIRDDDGDEENTDGDLDFSELLEHLGELCSYLFTRISRLFVVYIKRIYILVV